MAKRFVLDTSVLLYDADCLFNFKDNEVIIPSIVYEEINIFKERHDERGYAARQILSILDELSKVRPLKIGVYLRELPEPCPYKAKVKNGNTLIRMSYDCYNNEIENHFVFSKNDYLIIACAVNTESILITRDKGMRVIGRDFVKVEEYEADMINTKEIYKGYRKIYTDAEEIEALYQGELTNVYNLYPNEFAILIDQNNPNHTGVGIAKQRKILPCDFEKLPLQGLKTKPLNLEQKMLLYLLLDEDVRCVTVAGKSGKGKSLISIDYALTQVFKKNYNKFLYFKSVIPVDRREELGYYKGTPEEKLKPHIVPLYSSIEFLFQNELYKGKKRLSVDQKIEELLEADIIGIHPLANIRGMSIFNQVVMLDEAQNTTPHMIKTLVSRVNDNCKLIIAGDIEQIDDRNLNAYNNGLTHLIEKGKGEDYIGHITMDLDNKSKRGRLAAFGANML